MDESNLSKSNTTTTSQPQTDQFPTLPPEVMLLIIQLLPHKDQQTFCLLSQWSRQLALSCAFRELVYSQKLAYQIKRFDKARGDVKAAIKKLVLHDAFEGLHQFWDYKSILFPFLRSLPNLQSFQWVPSPRLRNQGILQLVASLQHCPLEHFAYWGPHVTGEPVTAPPRLTSLSVRYHHAHVYDFIQPSFSTLVELQIYPDSVMFDLLPLKPVGRTLRKFVYTVNGFDPDILDTIPDVFPHLTTLELAVRNTTQDSRWKDSYDASIAKNTKLQFLTVSASDFTFCHWSHQLVHFRCRKCGDQRLQATRNLAMACIGLKCCRWDHSHAQYCFNVRLSRKSSEGNILIRVKRLPVTDRYDPFDYRRW